MPLPRFALALVFAAAALVFAIPRAYAEGSQPLSPPAATVAALISNGQAQRMSFAPLDHCFNFCRTTRVRIRNFVVTDVNFANGHCVQVVRTPLGRVIAVRVC